MLVTQVKGYTADFGELRGGGASGMFTNGQTGKWGLVLSQDAVFLL